MFDPSLLSYSTHCEESQGFSPRFNAFLRAQTERLVERYDLRGKTVLEIGCGKGDFLELLCELGDNRGIGIDPGCDPDRAQSRAGARRTEYIRDYYGEDHVGLVADVICCRHTLEHIAPVRPFLDLVRRGLGDRRDALVFFEVPDVERVLTEAAFWDVYYEHCSYFSLGSLGRLFEACGFDVLELYKDFDDQYLFVVARPRAVGAPAREGSAHNGLDVAVRAFEERVGELAVHWERFVRERREQNRRLVVWGSSSKGVAFLTSLKLGEGIEAVVDINPYKQGKFMPGSGHEIVSPEALVDLRPDTVIAMNPIYLDEIRTALTDLGLHPELVAT